MDVGKMRLDEVANVLNVPPNDVVDLISVAIDDPEFRQRMRLLSKQELKRKKKTDRVVIDNRLSGRDETQHMQLVFDGLFSLFFDIPIGAKLDEFLYKRFAIDNPAEQNRGLYRHAGEEMKAWLSTGQQRVLIVPPRFPSTEIAYSVHRRDILSLADMDSYWVPAQELVGWMRRPKELWMGGADLDFAVDGFYREGNDIKIRNLLAKEIRLQLNPQADPTVWNIYEDFRVTLPRADNIPLNALFRTLGSYFNMITTIALLAHERWIGESSDVKTELIPHRWTSKPELSDELINLAKRFNTKWRMTASGGWGRLASMAANSITSENKRNEFRNGLWPLITKRILEWLVDGKFNEALSLAVRKVELRDVLNAEELQEPAVYDAAEILEEEHVGFSDKPVLYRVNYRHITSGFLKVLLYTSGSLPVATTHVDLPYIVGTNLPYLLLMLAVQYQLMPRESVVISTHKAPNVREYSWMYDNTLLNYKLDQLKLWIMEGNDKWLPRTRMVPSNGFSAASLDGVEDGATLTWVCKHFPVELPDSYFESLIIRPGNQ